MLNLDPAAREVVRLLDGVSEGQLAAPTPCPDMPVAALLNHLMGLSLAFTWAARKTSPVEQGAPAGPPPAPTAEGLDPDWRSALPKRLAELVDAWREPSAWTGQAEAGGTTLPAQIVGLVVLDELVLHGWDLARATGQSFNCDPVSTEAVLGFTTESARPENAANRTGLFGPVVPVPSDAPALDRALGLAGRDPHWTPPAV